MFARIVSLLVRKSPWQNVSMVYFNAWPEKDRGYNHFETMDQRAKVFNNALTAMEKFQPDMILIACNTLSVIYPFTPYSQTTKTKVFGIIDHGVQLIYDHLMADPDSHVIIFGTPTTIAEKSHYHQLVKMGIEPDRIINQGCINLAGRIERNPFGEDVSEMITANVSEAILKMDTTREKVYAALCCTHFGYCRDLFQVALSKHVKGDAVILNPNERMADHIINDQQKDPSMGTFVSSPDIDFQVVSRVFWEPERIDAYVKLLNTISSDVANALVDYEWNPELFEI